MATVLIVDDHAVTRRTLSHTLRKGGHAVLAAHGGQAALALLRDQAVDLAIVDLAMPDMDGLTLLRHLRADQRFARLPVVMLTASGQDEDRLAARSAGANGFLTKPASSREVIETVDGLLSA